MSGSRHGRLRSIAKPLNDSECYRYKEDKYIITNIFSHEEEIDEYSLVMNGEGYILTISKGNYSF